MIPRFLPPSLPLSATLLLLTAQLLSPAHAQVPPANDNFANAEFLVEGTWLGSNVDATSEPGEPAHAGVGTGSSIWFQWTAPTDGFLTVDTIGSGYDTVLAMYIGDAVDALAPVASNDDAFGLQSELPNVPVTSGVVYSIAVDGYNAAQGSVTLTASFFDGVDTTPPVISLLQPVDGATYVENGLVQASYACEDEVLGSGIASCIGDVAVGELIDTSVPGASTFTVTATDVAGNVGTATASFTIDGTDAAPPIVVLSAPADGAVYSVGSFIVAEYTCIDELFGTGVVSCIGDVASGSAVDTSVPGTFAFMVTGTDAEGNVASETASYTVISSPDNDNFSSALVLSESGTWTGTNVAATAESGEPAHHSVPTGSSIWFQWTAPESGYLTVDTFGSDFDTVLAIYTGAAVDALTPVASNDDTFGLQSRLDSVPVTSGITYSIAVDGYNAAQGNVTLNFSFFDGTDTTPPAITFFQPVDGSTYVEGALVAASYSCEDETLGSGVASCVGDVANGELIATSTPGANVFTVTATDVAGNVGTASVTYSIEGVDVTPPVVAIATPADGAVYAVGASIVADYSCADEQFGSGVASCVGDTPAGSPIDTSALGTFSFTVSAADAAGNNVTATSTYTIVASPDNDNFANAALMSGAAGTWNGTNVGATVEPGEPNHVYLPSNASIWFQWTATLDGYLTVDTFGSSFDTALAMYTGTSVDALTRVAANIDAGGTNQSQMLNIPVTAGVTYSIAVDGFFGQTGLVTLNWEFLVQFDFEPPVITLWSPIDGSVIPQHDRIWAGYSCYDPVPGTGLETCEGNIPNNMVIDTSVPGSYTFTVTATDVAGNTAEASAGYTVVANPPNDDFADALVLDVEGTTSGTNLGATDELSEPYHAGTLGGASVWFRWTAPADGFISANTLGSDFDTLLAIYTGVAVNALTEVDANDDAVGAQSAVHDAPVSAGVTYSIAISGAWGDTGNYTLTWSFLELNDVTPPTVAIQSPEQGGLYFQNATVFAAYSCNDEALGSGVASCVGDAPNFGTIDTSAPGPATFTVSGTDNSGNVTINSVSYTVQPMTNDNFDQALPISGSGHLVATNVGATREPGEPEHAGDPGGASIWFSWTAEEDGFLSVETLLSDLDTTLAVYTGASVDALTELGSNNDTQGQQSRVQDIPVVTGETYYIAIDGVGGATGQIIDFNWVAFNGPTFAEITPIADPLWVTDAEHDFWLNAAAPADVDGDGDLDLAVIGYYVEYGVSATDRLVVFINEGSDVDGRWIFTTQEVPLNGLYTNESDLAWGDFDGDGDPDLAVGAEGATELYRNVAGTLVPVETQLPAYNEDSNYSNAYDLRSLTWADFDNDSDLDLLIPSTFDQTTFSYSTALMRNDGPDGNGGWIFTEAPSQIDATIHAQTAWADHDGDGDLDLFMANVDNFFENGFVRTYRNDNGVFTSSEPVGNLSIEYGVGDWSDYDGDGDLDILVAGLVLDTDGQYKTLLRIYNNVNGVYQPDTIVQSSFFPWLDLHAATWADYDSDGDVDILLTGSFIGEDNIEGKSEVYVNDGGEFVPLGRDLPAPVSSSGNGGSFTWFDVDGDGDLDYFVAGAYWVPNGNNRIEAQMHLYRNDALVPNAAPNAPTGLGIAKDGGDITLFWDAATDDATPAEAITYDLEVRPQGARAGGVARRLPQSGNVSTSTSWSLKGLPPGEYLWLVRAVDSAFNGSAAAVSTFTIGPPLDLDGDGVVDALDNCTLHANPDQRDTDGDGFGNRCDPDLNGDGVTNFVDLGMLKAAFFGVDANADLNGDGAVNFSDLAIMKSFFFQPPGPSGVE